MGYRQSVSPGPWGPWLTLLPPHPAQLWGSTQDVLWVTGWGQHHGGGDSVPGLVAVHCAVPTAEGGVTVSALLEADVGSKRWVYLVCLFQAGAELLNIYRCICASLLLH